MGVQIMRTKFTTWTFNEKENKWYGICIECRGEKAKYTPDQRKQENIKPCSMCSSLRPDEEGK